MSKSKTRSALRLARQNKRLQRAFGITVKSTKELKEFLKPKDKAERISIVYGGQSE